MSDFGELAELDVALYRALLARPNSTILDFTDMLDSTSDDLGKCAARLTAMGLLRQRDDETMIAVSPRLAEATVLGAEDL